MLLSKAARPASGKHIFERLGPSDSSKWVAQDAFDEFKGAERNLAISFNPVTKVLPKLWMKHGFPLNVAGQVPSPDATFPTVPVFPFGRLLVEGR